MNYAVIVAGGNGSRMKSSIPKQFIELQGKPILFYTVQNFLQFKPKLKIILVLPPHDSKATHFLESYFPNQSQIQLVSGGLTRFHSVQNGLRAIPQNETGIVFIHDGVRPFVSQQVMQQCYETANNYGDAIPCLPSKDSLRRVTDLQNAAVPRQEYVTIQTPQTFQIAAIKSAYACEYDEAFTDEASVYEYAGNEIHLVPGNEENIKITTPFDLDLANLVLTQKHDATRIH
ncbi:MAG: 2-C-methyl-D-erythritol 4-phosphate cytidylyltransferase [Bacteroidetes bacterium]|nr:2-C-methyl-D-erythritol 4-phosphate cytidylyltransferase [Bacteroidota bacterium]